MRADDPHSGASERCPLYLYDQFIADAPYGPFVISETRPLEQTSPDIFSGFSVLDEPQVAEGDRYRAIATSAAISSGGEPDSETAVRIDG